MERAGLKPGFSLVELMVTVALVAFILGIGVTYLSGPQYQLKAAVFALRSAFQRTEFAAIKRNRKAYLDFDINDNGAVDSKPTSWADNNDNGVFDGGGELLALMSIAPGISYGSVPSSKGGPQKSPEGDAIPSDGVSFSGAGNGLHAMFRPDGTSSTGTVYLCIAGQPNAGTYAVMLNSIGHTNTWYFRTGASAWQAR